MIKYTNSHEWVLVDQNIGTVGITDYAQKELGAIVFAGLPPINKVLNMGEEAAILESTKAAADIYSPLSGEVIEVNPKLATSAGLINTSAEDLGWLFKIKIENLEELKGLLSKEDYLKMIQS